MQKHEKSKGATDRRPFFLFYLVEYISITILSRQTLIIERKAAADRLTEKTNKTLSCKADEVKTGIPFNLSRQRGKIRVSRFFFVELTAKRVYSLSCYPKISVIIELKHAKLYVKA